MKKKSEEIDRLANLGLGEQQKDQIWLEQTRVALR